MIFFKSYKKAGMKSEEYHGACSTKDKHDIAFKFLTKNLKGSDKFLGPDVEKRMILNCISKICSMRVWT
jgi:hypothetical protein